MSKIKREKKRQQDIKALTETIATLRQENERLLQEKAELAERIVGLRVLQQIAQSLSSELNLERLLRKILRSAIEVMQATAGSLLLFDKATDELVFEVIEGGGKVLEKQRMSKNEGIAGWVFTHAQPLIVDDVEKDERFYSGFDETSGFRTMSLICVPLIAKGENIGVLEILNKLSGEPFDDDDLDILTTLAAQSATAIENARLYKNVREERDRILAVEEEVRKQLARDLHDGPAQLLSAMIMNIKFLQELLRRDVGKVGEELDSFENLSGRALRQVRNMLFDLRPVILETQGLVPALQSYVQRLLETEDTVFHLQVENHERILDFKTEATVFSIVQEAITNIKKHAGASNVWLTLEEREDSLFVTIKDDGKGFDVKEVEKSYDRRGSLGLLNMRERTELIGGQISFDSAIGQGTSVNLVVPIPHEGKSR
ncbi:MAG: GAF domain-containing protein [Anaerolineae bacterium]